MANYKRKYDDAIYARAKAMRDAGMTYHAIAKVLGIPRSSAHSMLIQRAVPKPRAPVYAPRKDPANIAKVRELAAQGLNKKEIARETGFSKSMVFRMCETYRISTMASRTGKRRDEPAPPKSNTAFYDIDDYERRKDAIYRKQREFFASMREAQQ